MTDNEDFLNKIYPGRDDDLMRRCQALATRTYNPGIDLAHEVMADHIAGFLRDRLAEEPATPHRDALVSVVNAMASSAGYASNGNRAIRQALAALLRLAHPYAAHPDYDVSWRP